MTDTEESCYRPAADFFDVLRPQRLIWFAPKLSFEEGESLFRKAVERSMNSDQGQRCKRCLGPGRRRAF